MEGRVRVEIKDHSGDERCPVCKQLSKKSIRRNRELNEYIANKLESANMQAEIATSRFQPLAVPVKRVAKLSVQNSDQLVQTEEIKGDIVKKLREEIDESDSWSDSETHLPLKARKVDTSPERGRKIAKTPKVESPQELSPIRIPIKLHKKKKSRRESESSNSELQWISLERHP